MKEKPILLVAAVLLVVVTIVLFNLDNLSIKDSQCKPIQDNYLAYVKQFQDMSCLDDNECAKTGNRVGFCNYCVSNKIDLNKVGEFGSQYMSNQCYNKGFSNECLAVVFPCKCVNNRCQFVR